MGGFANDPEDEDKAKTPEAHEIQQQSESHLALDAMNTCSQGQNMGGFASDSEDENEAQTPEAQETQRQVEIDVKPDTKPKSFLEEFNSLEWAVMYSRFLADRMGTEEAAETDFLVDPDSELEGIGNLTLSDSSSSPRNPPNASRYNERRKMRLKALEQCRENARIAKESTWHLLDNFIDVLTMEVLGSPLEEDIAFRVFDSRSNSRYHFDQGDFRCGLWDEFDINRNITRDEAASHIQGDPKPTKLISISTSPLRVRNMYPRIRPKTWVAVIDLRILRKLGIAYGSTTTDLNFRGLSFATEHHVLVSGWIPKRSILGFLTHDRFHRLLEDSPIDTITDRNILQRREYDKKLSFELIEEHLHRDPPSDWSR